MHQSRTLNLQILTGDTASWAQAVEKLFPHTPHEYVIWDIIPRHPPSLNTDISAILTSSGRETSSEDMLLWGESKGLRPLPPVALFALAKQYPTLNLTYATRSLTVVSLVPCVYRGVIHVCVLSWDGEGQEAMIEFIPLYHLWGSDDTTLFAFEKSNINV